MSAKLIYLTAGSTEEAEKIATILIEKKLAACVNIFAPSISIYRWEGEVKREEEVVLIAKSKSSRTSQLIQTVLETHSYDCPAISVIDIVDGNPEFLKWIDNNTA